MSPPGKQTKQNNENEKVSYTCRHDGWFGPVGQL